MVNYKCEICNKVSTQKSHHDAHLKSKDHRKECEIFRLNLVANSLEEILEEYPQFKSDVDRLSDEDFLLDGESEQDNLDAVKNAEKNLKYEIAKNIIKMKSTVKSDEICDIQNNISNKDALRDKIHDIHNFLRNNGAGYGMNALKVFNIIYGLKKITDGNLREKTGLSDKCDFSYLLTLANTGQDDKLCSLIIVDILDELNRNKELKSFLFYEIPRKMKPNVFSHLVKEINKITDVEKSCNVQLSGKIYEYFIGRDQTAISELGAYFTDRHIVNYIYNMLQIQPNEDGTIPDMIDMFGGSGGFTTGYVNYMDENYDIDWKTEINKVHHYDANEDVIKSAALELFCLTGEFPNMENIKYRNSFTHDFDNKKYKLIITNPPYGGDKNKKSDAQEKREKLKLYIKKELKELEEDKETNKDTIVRRKKQLKNIENEEKFENKEKKKQKVTIETSSQRVRDFASSNDLKGNDKESVSLIQLMDMSAPNGIVVGVLKEGVFFNRSYKLHRKHLIENFNVKKVVSIPSDQFENTSTKTSILYFENTEEKTSSVKFSELEVVKYTEDKFEEINGHIVLTENEGDVKGIEDKLVSVANVQDILNQKDISLTGKEYNKIDIVPGDGYELVRLGDICEYKNGYGFSSDLYKSSGIPLLSIKHIPDSHNTNINISGCHFIDNMSEYDKNIIQNKSILIALSGNTIGKFTMYNNTDKIYCNQRVGQLQITICEPNIIYYILQSINLKNIIVQLSSSSAQANISMNDIININIPIPKDKQKMIELSDKISEPYNEKLDKEQRIKELEKELQERVKTISENEDCEEKTIGELCTLHGSGHYTKIGKKEGKYRFYNSSQNSKLYVDFCEFNEWCIILGQGGEFNIHIDKNFTPSKHVCVLKLVKQNELLLLYIYYLIPIIKDSLIVNGSIMGWLNNGNIKKIKLKIPKNKQLITDMEPQFQELEQLHVDVKNADKKYKDLIEELKNEAIKQ